MCTTELYKRGILSAGDGKAEAAMGQQRICRYVDSRRKNRDSLREQKQEGHAQLRTKSDLTPDTGKRLVSLGS